MKSVFCSEAPVSILGNSGNPEHYSLVVGEQLILECEVSQDSGVVQWLCNGRVLNPDSRTHIESKGTMRRLVLSSLQVSDSGEYICDAFDDKMTIMVSVQGKSTKACIILARAQYHIFMSDLDHVKSIIKHI